MFETLHPQDGLRPSDGQRPYRQSWRTERADFGSVKAEPLPTGGEVTRVPVRCPAARIAAPAVPCQAVRVHSQRRTRCA
jgi:hypothetical protein